MKFSLSCSVSFIICGSGYALELGVACCPLDTASACNWTLKLEQDRRKASRKFKEKHSSWTEILGTNRDVQVSMYRTWREWLCREVCLREQEWGVKDLAPEISSIDESWQTWNVKIRTDQKDWNLVWTEHISRRDIRLAECNAEVCRRILSS